MSKNITIRSSSAIAKSGKSNPMLDAIRASKAVVATKPVVAPQADLIKSALESAGRPRLVFAIDATASRDDAWDAAKKVTDTLFEAVPDALDVALAVHGGDEVHTYTEFCSDYKALRGMAGRVHCQMGGTRLNEILKKTIQHERVKVVVYIGDVFEEDVQEAIELAETLKIKGCRIVIHAGHEGSSDHRAFQMIAKASNGCVLPFNANAIKDMRANIEAIAILASGGTKLLANKAQTSQAAALLLSHIK